MDIAIHGIDFGMSLKSARYGHEDIRRGKEIVGIQHSYHISRCSGNTLVHGIVESTVRNGNDAHTSFKTGLVFLTYAECFVLRCTVLDNKLIVPVGLPENGIKRMA